MGERRGQLRPQRGPGHKKKQGKMDRGHSRSCRAGAIEKPKGNRASRLGPHLPGAVEGLDPIKEALKVLWLGLVPCGNTASLSPPSLIGWDARLITQTRSLKAAEYGCEHEPNSALSLPAVCPQLGNTQVPLPHLGIGGPALNAEWLDELRDIGDLTQSPALAKHGSILLLLQS